jgi:hypothetical protein
VRDCHFIDSCLVLVGGKNIPIQVHLCVLNVLANFADTNQENQDLLGTDSVRQQVVERFLQDCDKETEQLGDMTYLLLSHLTWNHQKNQSLFGTKVTVEKLLEAIDKNKFYALLCLTNMLYQNSAIQDYVQELDGISKLTSGLDSQLE